MIGQRLKSLRLLRGKTQQDLADVLNISRSAYALYEADGGSLATSPCWPWQTSMASASTTFLAAPRYGKP